MGGVGGLLNKTMGALSKLASGGGSWHMCYLILFVFAFFFMIKWLLIG